MISAKTGVEVGELLEAMIERIPAPEGDAEEPLQALVFDSHYDQYRGVVVNVRIVNGELHKGDTLRLMVAARDIDADEVGVYAPSPTAVDGLGPGEVGYLVPGLKGVADAKVGDTITVRGSGSTTEPLPGYKEPQPVVFCGLYPAEGEDYSKNCAGPRSTGYSVNDASFAFEPETSTALGFGFRVGFLGLLHMEIIRERLDTEYDVAIVATAPNVEYRVVTTGGEEVIVDNPSALPTNTEHIEEPFVRATLLMP